MSAGKSEIGNSVTFAYFTALQAEAYSFYRIPKVLFTDPFFRQLSCEAKVLYGLLLDRMSLSLKNRWFDEEDRVYIIFTIKNVMEMLGCCTATAVKLMNELDTEHGIGLVEKKRLGLGKANVIYVKNFMIREDDAPENSQEKERTESTLLGNKDFVGTSGSEQNGTLQMVSIGNPINAKSSKKQNSGILKNRNQECQESEFRNARNQNIGVSESRSQELYGTECSDIDVNKTDLSKTDLNKTGYPYKAIIDYLNEAVGTAFKDKSKDTRSLIRAKIEEGFTEQDFFTVIDKKVAEWKGTEMSKYLRPATLFGKNFESYLNQTSYSGKGKGFNNFTRTTFDWDAAAEQILEQEMWKSV